MGSILSCKIPQHNKAFGSTGKYKYKLHWVGAVIYVTYGAQEISNQNEDLVSQ
jgi:hypothetical protein